MPRPVSPHVYSSRGSLRQRVASAALALAIAALVIVGLILSGFLPQVFIPMGTRTLSTFDVSGGSKTPTPTRRPKPQAKAAAKQAPKTPARTLPPPIVAMRVSPPTGMIVLSKDDFAAADIGKIKGTADAGSGDKGTQTADSPSTYGPSDGPGGKTLYGAEWVREPTRAELTFYLPAKQDLGWGMIACRTIPRNRVDDCRVIGETPGSGIGRGLREAAWQFQVLPPRVNGRPMIGAWVRIRFDLVRGLVK